MGHRRSHASAGWAKWTPVSATAIGAHLFGSGGLLAANTPRVAGRRRLTH